MVRAMCIDPSFTQLPECADFNLAKTVDPGPDFIDRIFKPFEEVSVDMNFISDTTQN